MTPRPKPPRPALRRNPRHAAREHTAHSPPRRARSALGEAARRLSWFAVLAAAGATAALASTGMPPTGAAPGVAGGGFCAPPALGAPCAAGGAAAPGNPEPLPALGLGNPVHLATGNKYQLEVDLPPNPSAPGLELVRHYNGLSIEGGALGRNWAFSYDTRLRRRGSGWSLYLADGRIRPVAAPLPESGGHAWQWPDGRRLHFDAGGRLERISQQGRPLVRIHRHAGPHALAGLIDRVESASGHALRFRYAGHGGEPVVESIETPLGVFRYRHDSPGPASGHRSPRLAAVQRPDGMLRTYHHEPARQAGNPYALTGLSLSPPHGAARRLATWRYDRHGRVVALRRHGQAVAELRIEYLEAARGPTPGLTRLHGGDGRRHDVRFVRIGDEYRRLGGVEYDPAGRLAAIGALRLRRGADGGLAALAVAEPGWPGLALQRLRHPPGLAWQSAGTGRTTLSADAHGRPAHLRHANGDTLQVYYGPQGRPLRLDETGSRPPRRSATLLQWRGPQLRRVEHPAETETRGYDAAGRLTHRGVYRPADTASAAARFRESFHYDAHGRLSRHQLPEGGALHYAWHGNGPRAGLAALWWEDRQGRRHTVIDSAAGQPGYRHGNGLERVALRTPGGHTDTLYLADGATLWWRQHRRHDAAGRIVHDAHDFPPAAHHDRQHYVYDARSRLRGALHRQPGARSRWWYAWHDDGRLAALDNDGRVTLPALRRDASGLPLGTAGHGLHYGPSRRLERVTHADTGQTLAQYRHNAFGHRIIKRDKAGDTHFLYLRDRLVAEARSPAEGRPPAVTRRYLYARAAPVGMIDYPPQGPAALYAVHADLSGAPRLLTDAGRRIRWLAGYTPTGQARQVAGDLRFPLRLPGQYEDAETGWHDNLLRTYAPELGQYLEPDPIGPLPGTDAFGYAGQQPWRYADPYGLLLFAFDGTRYSADSAGNVHKLAEAYRDGAAHYHSGPGNSHFLDWDAVVAWRAGRILENQWQALLTALEHQPPGRPVPIDLIGFSRGAALARHFGNRIAAHVHNGVFSVTDPLRGPVSACVDLRFMGLFDSVAQFGVGGSHNHLYDFGVAELWSWVAHAVALHEHRWNFPLLSADAGGAGNVVEAPFIGAHADIGGGVAPHPERPAGGQRPAPGGSAPDTPAPTAPEGVPPTDEAATDAASALPDLADVALAWMHWQALAANIDFADLARADTLVQSPVLRDLRNPLWRTLQSGDRAVQAPSGAARLDYQDDDPRLGRDARAQTEAFIDRVEGWRSQAGDHVGTVDMAGYSRWLEETLGWSP